VATPSPPPPPPDADVVARHRQVVIAGHTGDLHSVLAHSHDPSPLVRQAALSALHRLGELTAAQLSESFLDPEARVRARAAELSAHVADITPAPLLDDDDAFVVEIASFACGEMVLGAIGDPQGLDAVLTACTDRVTVRRRATLALAAFDDPRADAALRVALDDKDWQVRQAAEDLLEVGRVLDAPPDPDAYAD